MQSTVVSATKDVPGADYPALYRGTTEEQTGFIVLMHSAGCGTVLAQVNTSYDVGHYSELWQMHMFSKVNGPVTINFF